jgi:hypothetical protein
MADIHDVSTVTDVPAEFLAAGNGWETKKLENAGVIANAKVGLKKSTDFHAAKVVCGGKQAAALGPGAQRYFVIDPKCGRDRTEQQN